MFHFTVKPGIFLGFRVKTEKLKLIASDYNSRKN